MSYTADAKAIVNSLPLTAPYVSDYTNYTKHNESVAIVAIVKFYKDPLFSRRRVEIGINSISRAENEYSKACY